MHIRTITSSICFRRLCFLCTRHNCVESVLLWPMVALILTSFHYLGSTISLGGFCLASEIHTQGHSLKSVFFVFEVFLCFFFLSVHMLCNGCSGWGMFLHSRWAPVILDVCITDLHLCKCWCSVCSAAQCIDGFSVHCCIAELHECGDRAKHVHIVLRLLLSYCYLIAHCNCGWEAILVLFSTLRKPECHVFNSSKTWMSCFQFFENLNVRVFKISVFSCSSPNKSDKTCGFLTLWKTWMSGFSCYRWCFLDDWKTWMSGFRWFENEQAEGTKCPCKSPAACSTIHVMHYACIARCIMSAELGLAWSPAPLGPITHRLASPTIQARAGHVRVVFFFGKCLFPSGPLLNKMGQFKFYRNILLRRQCKSTTEDLPPNQKHIVFEFAFILIVIGFSPMLAQDVFIQTQHTQSMASSI